MTTDMSFCQGVIGEVSYDLSYQDAHDRGEVQEAQLPVIVPVPSVCDRSGKENRRGNIDTNCPAEANEAVSDCQRARSRRRQLNTH